MSWFTDLILEPTYIQAIILIFLVSTIGIQLGKIKIFNISLGITFVFFVGILLGHFNVPIDKTILQFTQGFGLILFIYAMGLQVGPGFFSSLKSSGLKLNILALLVVFIGIILAISLSFIFDVSMPNMIGVLCGAVTNTPALGAAQQAVLSVSTADSRVVTDMALATAIAYPMGVTGVIFAIVVLRKYLSPNSVKTSSTEDKDTKPYVGEFQILNPAINGKTIKQLMLLAPHKFVISRVFKKDQVIAAKSDTILDEGDRLMIISVKSDMKSIEVLLGKQMDVDWNKSGIDWNKIDNSHLVSKEIVVTKNEINGQKLGALRIRNQYGVNITRIRRVGIQLLASPNLSLQVGDNLTIVGEIGQIEKVSKILGDEVKKLEYPNLIAIFTGIILGLILGSVPFYIPGMSLPVKLGIAGGPVVVGILMGAFGPRFKITTYTTQSVNLFLREFGLVIYLACLGISSGEFFFDTIMQFEGLKWFISGILLTIIPVMIVGLLAIKIFKIDFENGVGMLCGSMTNPIALAFINNTTDSDNPSVAYATVYPITIFIRIISAQVLIMIFF